MLGLILAASEPIPIEVVGGDGKAFSLFSAVAGSLLVALAAVIAAIVAARTANKRQRAQLDHDTEVRRREHIRDALDDAAEKLYEAFEALAVYELRIGEAEDARKRLETARDESSSEEVLAVATKALDQLQGQIEEVREETTSLLLAVQASEFRLSLRMGGEDPVVEAHLKVKESFRDLRRALDSGWQRSRTDEEIAACEKQGDESNGIYAQFFVAGERWNAANSSPAK